MLRALWFLFKLGVLLAGIIWLVQRPGTVEVRWLGYTIETSVGFAAAVLLAVGVVWTFIYKVISAFVSVPAVFRRYQVAARREKGYRAVTSGLVAVAAGDAQSAEKYAKRAEYMIPGVPLTKLLTAQSALMNGNAPKARREFSALLEDDSAAFFGLRGLLTEHLRDGNAVEALALIRRAEELQPRRVWVVRTLFDLETRQAEWRKAEITLKKAERLGVFDAATARRHRQAILTARAEELIREENIRQAMSEAARAFGIDAAFSPAALRLARIYLQMDKRRAALKTLENAWKAQPHPELAALWMRLQPPAKRSASIYDAGKDAYAWMKRLTDLKPEHRDSRRALGTAALNARMWKEARAHLTEAGDYRQLARLERDETGSEARAREWMEMAADHPAEPRWICTDCGRTLPEWQALCPHCQSFNKIEWMLPSADALPSMEARSLTIAQTSIDPDPFAPPMPGRS